MFTSLKQFLSCITFKPSPKTLFILHMEYIVLLAALCSDLMHRNEQFVFYLYSMTDPGFEPGTISPELWVFPLRHLNWQQMISLDIYFRLLRYCTDWKNIPSWCGLEPITSPLIIRRPNHCATETEGYCISFDIYFILLQLLSIRDKTIAGSNPPVSTTANTFKQSQLLRPLTTPLGLANQQICKLQTASFDLSIYAQGSLIGLCYL